MKNAMRISVENPCSEKFENFSTTEAGGFCDSCQKEVIDFTAMNSNELLNYLSNTKGETCGRFRTSQLKTYTPVMTTSNKSLVSRGLAVMSFSLLALCTTNLQAQEVAHNETTIKTELSTIEEPFILGEISVVQYIVSGIVTDEENLPLAGVNVVLKGSTEGVVTDLDGTFEFSRPLEAGSILVFSYIGYNPQEYKVVDHVTKNENIKITFDLSDIFLMGAVEVEGVYGSKQNLFQKFVSLFK